MSDEDTAAASRLIPAWFIPRMMNDSWSFGLLLESGHVLCIETISKVRRGEDGTVWLDVVMLDRMPVQGFGPLLPANKMIIAPTSRTSASIQASKIVAAFELADT